MLDETTETGTQFDAATLVKAIAGVAVIAATASVIYKKVQAKRAAKKSASDDVAS